jgi:hypothetical protein
VLYILYQKIKYMEPFLKYSQVNNNSVLRTLLKCKQTNSVTERAYPCEEIKVMCAIYIIIYFKP